MNDRQYFMLKRLHSLSGVIPVAGFVIFHLFENSHSVQGPEAFNQIVHFIRHQPYLYLLEAGLLMPIIFHALLGVWLAKSAKHNVGRFPNRANISYTLQRITGGILLFFIAYHVYTTRFANIPSDQMFQELVKQVSNPLVSAFYALGILAAAFHLSNGLWGFLVAWGIVSGAKSMENAWKACIGLGVAVALMGLNALAGFHGKGVNIFDHKEAPAASEQAPAAPVATTSTASAGSAQAAQGGK
jgi:succinate dehydrogenase / fumarate reductase cytochrome b subunit